MDQSLGIFNWLKYNGFVLLLTFSEKKAYGVITSSGRNPVSSITIVGTLRFEYLNELYKVTFFY